MSDSEREDFIRVIFGVALDNWLDFSTETIKTKEGDVDFTETAIHEDMKNYCMKNLDADDFTISSTSSEDEVAKLRIAWLCNIVVYSDSVNDILIYKNIETGESGTLIDLLKVPTLQTLIDENVEYKRTSFRHFITYYLLVNHHELFSNYSCKWMTGDY